MAGDKCENLHMCAKTDIPYLVLKHKATTKEVHALHFHAISKQTFQIQVHKALPNIKQTAQQHKIKTWEVFNQNI